MTEEVHQLWILITLHDFCIGLVSPLVTVIDPSTHGYILFYPPICSFCRVENYNGITKISLQFHKHHEITLCKRCYRHVLWFQLDRQCSSLHPDLLREKLAALSYQIWRLARNDKTILWTRRIILSRYGSVNSFSFCQRNNIVKSVKMNILHS